MKAFLYGAPIGALGGLIGLGGAEFRLPVLKVFGRTREKAQMTPESAEVHSRRSL